MAFRFDKLTIKAQEAVAGAQSLAADRGHPQVAPLHLLAALLAENDGIVGPIFERIGANRRQLDQMVQSELGHFAKVSGGSPPGAGQELQSLQDAIDVSADQLLQAQNTLNGTIKLNEAKYVSDLELERDKLSVKTRQISKEANELALELFKLYDFPKQIEKLRNFVIEECAY